MQELGKRFADSYGEWMDLLVRNIPNCHQIVNTVGNREEGWIT